MLVVDDISKKYGDNTAVHNISFSIKAGEIAGIIGPNGAGKSTFLKMVCGLLKPDSGSIKIGGKDIAADDITKRALGYVPEDSPVYDDMTVREYLHFFGDLYELPKAIIDKKMNDLFQSLDFTALDRELGNLSKGMKRKVMIARMMNLLQVLIQALRTQSLNISRICVHKIRRCLSVVIIFTRWSSSVIGLSS